MGAAAALPPAMATPEQPMDIGQLDPEKSDCICVVITNTFPRPLPIGGTVIRQGEYHSIYACKPKMQDRGSLLRSVLLMMGDLFPVGYNSTVTQEGVKLKEGVVITLPPGDFYMEDFGDDLAFHWIIRNEEPESLRVGFVLNGEWDGLDDTDQPVFQIQSSGTSRILFYDNTADEWKGWELKLIGNKATCNYIEFPAIDA